MRKLIAVVCVLGMIGVILMTNAFTGPGLYPEVKVYTFEKLLPKGAPLTDGDFQKFDIKDTTWFTWVDPHPEMRFQHETFYIFVNAQGDIEVKEGKWWPKLGGQTIMYGWKPWEVKFPVDVKSKTGYVKVYAYPKVITPKDKLTDGGKTLIKVPDDSLLYWVDLMPYAKFAHPTAYILVSANDKVHVEKGEWWPELNGKRILYNCDPEVLKFPYDID